MFVLAERGQEEEPKGFTTGVREEMAEEKGETHHAFHVLAGGRRNPH